MSNTDLITTLSEKYKINTSKPNFPVNTMRLFYLILTHELTGGNEETVTKVNEVIPKISAVLDARDLALTKSRAQKSDETHPSDSADAPTSDSASALQEVTSKGSSSELIFEACRKPLEELLKEIDTPQLRQSIQLLFSDVYPIQESLLSSIDHYLRQNQLTQADLLATLKIRAMDSVLYASVIDQIVQEHHTPEGDKQIQFNDTYILINQSLQINDLVDAIVYAKQDLAANAATLVEIMKRCLTPNTDVKTLVHDTFTKLTPEFGEKKELEAFVKKLVGVVG